MQSAGWPFPKQTLAEFNLNTTEGRSADSITYLLRASVCESAKTKSVALYSATSRGTKREGERKSGGEEIGSPDQPGDLAEKNAHT